tara:strand:+ start:209 stop:427 length:219 start_codon:yes stop_codon:yes gene_type:complete
MPLTNEEIQLIEQAVKNEVYNLKKIAERTVDPTRAQNWVIKKRRLEIAMRELRGCAYAPLREYTGNWRYDEI